MNISTQSTATGVHAYGIVSSQKEEKGLKKRLLKLWQRTSGFEKLAFIVILLGIVILLWFTYLIWSTGRGPVKSFGSAETGEAGDFVGGVVGSLWTFASVLLIYSALTLQRKDLGQVESQIEHERSSWERENFETTFFNLCDHLRQLKASLRVSGLRYDASAVQGVRADIFEGYDVFPYLAQLLKNFRASNSQFSIDDQLKEFFDETVFAAHYYRTVYHVLEYVDGYAPSNLGSNTHRIPCPKYYADLFQAELSASELLLIFYNSLHPDFGKLKRLLIKYDFLQNLPDSLLLTERDRELRRAEYVNEY